MPNQGGIVVTGANGQLGRCLYKAAVSTSGPVIHFLGREHLPIDNHALTLQVLDALKPAVIINAAAYTAVDKAESETALANNVNGYAVGNIAKYCRQHQVRLLHVSTDYVYDGLGTRPYVETDPTNPVNAYGASKLLGEQLAQEEHPDVLIFRTSWVYSPYGHNFLKTMLRLMKERDTLNVVDDQQGCPTYAQDLAAVLLNLALQEATPASGIYHYANQGITSWFGFAQAISQVAKLHCQVHPIPTSAFPTPARRPAWSVMDCQKIQHQFNITIRNWKDALDDAVMAVS